LHGSFYLRHPRHPRSSLFWLRFRRAEFRILDFEF